MTPLLSQTKHIPICMSVVKTVMQHVWQWAELPYWRLQNAFVLKNSWGNAAVLSLAMKKQYLFILNLNSNFPWVFFQLEERGSSRCLPCSHPHPVRGWRLTVAELSRWREVGEGTGPSGSVMTGSAKAKGKGSPPLVFIKSQEVIWEEMGL